MSNFFLFFLAQNAVIWYIYWNINFTKILNTLNSSVHKFLTINKPKLHMKNYSCLYKQVNVLIITFLQTLDKQLVTQKMLVLTVCLWKCLWCSTSGLPGHAALDSKSQENKMARDLFLTWIASIFLGHSASSASAVQCPARRQSEWPALPLKAALCPALQCNHLLEAWWFPP